MAGRGRGAETRPHPRAAGLAGAVAATDRHPGARAPVSVLREADGVDRDAGARPYGLREGPKAVEGRRLKVKVRREDKPRRG